MCIYQAVRVLLSPLPPSLPFEWLLTSYNHFLSVTMEIMECIQPYEGVNEGILEHIEESKILILQAVSFRQGLLQHAALRGWATPTHCSTENGSITKFFSVKTELVLLRNVNISNDHIVFCNGFSYGTDILASCTDFGISCSVHHQHDQCILN